MKASVTCDPSGALYQLDQPNAGFVKPLLSEAVR
jgi:hypothetical protein